MQTLRAWHLYLSCLFSPLLIYFSLSGAWQTFRWNDIPRGNTPTGLQRFFHELSKPHKEGTLPNHDPKVVHSVWFNGFALVMALGIVTTSLMGISLALQLARRRRAAMVLLVTGVLLPLLFLFIH